MSDTFNHHQPYCSHLVVERRTASRTGYLGEMVKVYQLIQLLARMPPNATVKVSATPYWQIKPRYAPIKGFWSGPGGGYQESLPTGEYVTVDKREGTENVFVIDVVTKS